MCFQHHWRGRNRRCHHDNRTSSPALLLITGPERGGPCSKWPHWMFQVVDLLFPLLDPPPVCPWYPRSHPCNQETAMATRKGVPVMQRWSNWQCETFQWRPTTNTLLSQMRPVDLNPKRYCNIPITPRLKCPQCVSVEIFRSQGTKYY